MAVGPPGDDCFVKILCQHLPDTRLILPVLGSLRRLVERRLRQRHEWAVYCLASQANATLAMPLSSRVKPSCVTALICRFTVCIFYTLSCCSCHLNSASIAHNAKRLPSVMSRFRHFEGFIFTHIFLVRSFSKRSCSAWVVALRYSP